MVKPNFSCEKLNIAIWQKNIRFLQFYNFYVILQFRHLNYLPISIPFNWALIH